MHEYSIFYILGIKLFFGIFCISATIFQSVILVENFNLKETLWKNTEEMYYGAMETPIIVLCSDPPHYDPDTDIVRNSGHSQTGETLKLQIGKLKTALKVTFKQQGRFVDKF